MIKVKKSDDWRRADLPEPILGVHQPEFLPWLGYISKAAMCDVYFILDTVQFRKNYFQNRNKIRIKNKKGWQWLTIPVLQTKKRLMNISEIKIDNKVEWRQKHLKSIKLSYQRAPYFDEIYPELEKIYHTYEGDFLVEFIVPIIKYAFNKFDVDVPVYRASEIKNMGFDLEGQKSDLLIKLCKVPGAKFFIFGQEGRTYVDRDRFSSQNIGVVFQKFDHPKYLQIHGEFIPKMSFIDLLFNHGKDSLKILNKSQYEKI